MVGVVSNEGNLYYEQTIKKLKFNLIINGGARDMRLYELPL